MSGVMEWNDLPASAMFDKARSGGLAHPTNASFNPSQWRDTLLGLESPNERDRRLATSAVYLGVELASLRATMAEKMVAGFARKRALRLLAAAANQQFLTARAKAFQDAKRSQRTKPVDFDSLGQRLFANSFGQNMTVDDAIAFLVDTLPYWLHRIWLAPDESQAEEPKNLPEFVGKAIATASIERSLRDLWHGALWAADWIDLEDGVKVDKPGNPALDGHWLVWGMRQDSIAFAEHGLDAGAGIIAGGKLPPVNPVLVRTVVKIGKRVDGRRRYIVGLSNGRSAEQRSHVSERDTLDRLYTGLFMDEPLPKPPGLNFTCRELTRAWWVLSDMAHLIMDELGKPWFEDDRGVGRFAIPTDANELAGVIAECLGIEGGRGRAILDFFTTDPGSTQALFNKGIWSTPLIPEPGTDRRYLILAPLIAGSNIRRIEAWMERGGISDGSGIKGRGKPFEAFVRRELAEALAENEALSDYAIHPNALKRKGGSEEIDLLVRVGEDIIVGEVKCLTSPSEPLEKHNYLKTLAKAAAQACTKLDWAKNNRNEVAELLGIQEKERVAALRFHAVVVLNHGFGIGLGRDGVSIVDLHFLRLLLGSNAYQGNTRFEKGVGMFYESVELYRDAADFAARLPVLLADPPPLRRYRNVLGWRREPFITSNGSKYLIELPAMIRSPVNPDAMTRVALMAGPNIG